jgi:hypothetical protein
MIGSPLKAGRELQELRSRTRIAATAGQFPKPVRNFSKMRTVRRRRAVEWRGRGKVSTGGFCEAERRFFKTRAAILLNASNA